MKTNTHFDHISLSSSWNEKCFEKRCGENKNTNFMFNKFFPKIMSCMR